MYLIIAGTRTFTDYNFLEKKLLFFLQNKNLEEITIISGNARGVDRLGEQFALKHGCKLISMPANWESEGKKAGYLRNEQMAKLATACIVFWDGKSKGTKHMIDLAKKYNLNLRIVKIN